MSPEQVADKAELLASAYQGRRALDEQLAQIPRARFEEPGAQDNWSVKDMLAHIAAWEQRMAHWLDEAARGEVSGIATVSADPMWIDRYNAQTYDENHDRPLAGVLGDYEASFPQAIKVVEALAEADLFDADRFPWRKGRPLWFLVAANTFWHYDEHREALVEWLAGGQRT